MVNARCLVTTPTGVQRKVQVLVRLGKCPGRRSLDFEPVIKDGLVYFAEC